MCFLCNKEESEYDYLLKNGARIPICGTCGKKLYGAGVGDDAKDSNSQLAALYKYVKVVKCAICDENESEYKYELIDGRMIPICKTCGEILYDTKIGEDTFDSRIQFALMIDYVNFVSEGLKKMPYNVTSFDENSKVLSLTNKRKTG